MHEQLAPSIADRFPVTRSRLEDLIRIPSVSAPGFDPAPLRRSAEAVAGMYEASGLTGVRLLEPGGAPPAVFAALPGPADGPTVLLYAHHDVQPAGEGWTTDPFEPVEREGRLYARGSSDDKSGVVLHAAALEALGPPYPVAIKIFIEGEEECGSPHLGSLLEQHGAELAADVIVVADTGNFRTGLPSFTTSLRGLVDCGVEVRTKRHAVHSGSYGGVFPDALTVLSRLLATLHDDAGRVAVARLVAGDADPLDLTEEELRAEVAAHDTLELIGHGSLTSRLWQQLALSVLAIDAPRVAEAVNALVPVARAKISLRLAPGQDPEDAFEALHDHLVSRAPWGAEVGVTRGSVGHPFALETGGHGYRAFREGFRHAWNREPVEVGVGGSIPFVAALAGAYPEAEMVLMGVGDHRSRPHGPDESLDLSELQRGALAEAIALAELGNA